MAEISVRNLGTIQAKDANLGQALRDLVQAVSTLKTEVAALQTQVNQLLGKS